MASMFSRDLLGILVFHLSFTGVVLKSPDQGTFRTGCFYLGSLYQHVVLSEVVLEDVPG